MTQQLAFGDNNYKPYYARQLNHIDVGAAS